MDKCASKKVFITRAIAKRTARYVKTKGRGNMRCNKLYPYKCSTCPYWHLTSQGKVATERMYK